MNVDNPNYCYPTLSVLDGVQLKNEQLKAKAQNGKYGLSQNTLKSYVTYKGNGINTAETRINLAIREMNELRDSRFNTPMKTKDAKLDEFEGLASSAVHRNLKDLPLEVLTDEGFWRYMAVVPMFDLIDWRHPTLGNNNFGLTPGRNFLRCLPLRMFLRSDLAWRLSEGKDYSLATSFKAGVDQWASHVIAQQYGCHPLLVRVMLESFADLRTRKVKQPTQVDREIAKELKLIRSVQVFEYFEDATPLKEILAEVTKISEAKVNPNVQ